MMINHFLPGEMVSSRKTPSYLFSSDKGLRQEGHPAFKLCLKPERIYVMSKIVERNNRTGTSYEGVVNGRTGVQVGPIRSISCEVLQKKIKLHISWHHTC